MSETMKAAVLEGINKVRIREIEKPKVRPDSLLLKVHACALCGSDLRIVKYGNKRVSYPQILGHEVAGEVVEVGENVSNFSPSDRIAVAADVPCGECEWCRNGLGNNCKQNYAIGYQLQGGLAQYMLLDPMVVKYGPVTKLPENISYEEGALAEPLACCLNGFELTNMSAGKSVLVIGAGPIGCLLTMLARSMDSGITIISDIDDKRLEMSKVTDADYYINNQKEDLRKKVMEATNNEGADVVFIACPSLEAQEMSLELVKNRGVINFFSGLPKDDRVSIPSNTLHYKEVSILGSHGCVPRHHKIAVDMIASGKVDVKKLITKTYHLEEFTSALDQLTNKNELKIVIRPWK